VERIPDCTGFLVAGGRAERLGGRAKGLLRVGGETIASRSVALLRELFGDTRVVANDPAPWAALDVPVIPDVLPGKGAPGGIHAALSASPTAWIFAAACDMPFLSGDAIRFLAGQREGTRAVVVEWRGRLEGMHAFWSREALPDLDRLLRAGDPSIRELARAVGARVVPEDAFRRVDPGGRSLENVNTPADLERLHISGDEGPFPR
jgi:molybdopterin-guanine dinucleotide biosynthesis protein A